MLYLKLVCNEIDFYQNKNQREINMKLKRYYTNEQLKENLYITLDGEEFHHLKNVMRSRVGDMIALFNGSTVTAEGEIVSIDKSKASIFIKKVEENPSEPKINFTLFQAVCKGDKLSLITQKITEIGATNLCVFYSKFTDIKDKTSKLDKLERVSISASKQCGRSSIIKPQGVIGFEQMIDEAKNLDKVYVAYENKDGNSLFESLQKQKNIKNIGLIIGAEGGFAEEEIDLLEKNNFEIVTLGKRILRTETASIVGTGLVMFALEK